LSLAARRPRRSAGRRPHQDGRGAHGSCGGLEAEAEPSHSRTSGFGSPRQAAASCPPRPCGARCTDERSRRPAGPPSRLRRHPCRRHGGAAAAAAATATAAATAGNRARALPGGQVSECGGCGRPESAPEQWGAGGSASPPGAEPGPRGRATPPVAPSRGGPASAPPESGARRGPRVHGLLLHPHVHLHTRPPPPKKKTNRADSREETALGWETGRSSRGP
jgi:hypothetical protein